MPHRDRQVRLAYLREYHRKRRADGTTAAYHRQRRAKLKALVHEARSQPCVDCGAPGEVLHHLDPSTKEFDLGSATRGRPPAGTVAGVRAEIAKCVPLCESCHHERHRRRNHEDRD